MEHGLPWDYELPAVDSLKNEYRESAVKIIKAIKCIQFAQDMKAQLHPDTFDEIGLEKEEAFYFDVLGLYRVSVYIDRLSYDGQGSIVVYKIRRVTSSSASSN